MTDPMYPATAAGRELTEEEARALTDEIRRDAERLWDKVTRAYTEQAWKPLGYTSWDAYCAEEFGSLRLRLPREDRTEIVQSLNEAGLSIRAITAATGYGYGTIQRELSGDPNGSPEPIDIETDTAEPETVTDIGAAIADPGRDALMVVSGSDDTPSPKPRPLTSDEQRRRQLDRIASRAAVLYNNTIAVHEQMEAWEKKWRYTTDAYELEQIACISDHIGQMQDLMQNLLAEMSSPTESPSPGPENAPGHDPGRRNHRPGRDCHVATQDHRDEYSENADDQPPF